MALAVAGIALVILAIGTCAALTAVAVLFCPPLLLAAPFVGALLMGLGLALAIKSIQNAQNAISKHLATPTTNVEILDIEALRIVAENNEDEIVEVG